MIEELEKRQQQLKEVIKKLPDIINNALKDVEGEIIKMNVDQQLKGFDASGKKLGGYAESTKKYRRRKGLQIAHIDLEDTQNYHSNFALKYKKDRVEVGSPDTPYSKWLDKRWNDLFGLVKENLQELAKMVDEPIHNEINKILA